MPDAIFITDAGARAGGGHLMRCTVLANALGARGWTSRIVAPLDFASVQFVSPGDKVEISGVSDAALLGPITLELAMAGREIYDLVVFDHYGIGIEYERSWRTSGRCLFAIDDLAARSHDVDILLDQTFGREADDYAGRVPFGATLLLGPRYALLRPEFAAARIADPAARDAIVHRPVRIFVGIGAIDDLGITEKLMDAIDAVVGDARVNVVLGHGSPNVRSVELKAVESRCAMQVHISPTITDLLDAMQADLAIGAGGVSAWERCALGLPSIVLVVAENQRANAAAIEMAGAGCMLQVTEPGWENTFADMLGQMLGDDEALARMSAAAARLCNGNGAHLVGDLLCDRAQDAPATKNR